MKNQNRASKKALPKNAKVQTKSAEKLRQPGIADPAITGLYGPEIAGRAGWRAFLKKNHTRIERLSKMVNCEPASLINTALVAYLDNAERNIEFLRKNPEFIGTLDDGNYDYIFSEEHRFDTADLPRRLCTIAPALDIEIDDLFARVIDGFLSFAVRNQFMAGCGVAKFLILSNQKGESKQESVSSLVPAETMASNADIQTLLNTILNKGVSLVAIEYARNRAVTLLQFLANLYAKEIEGNCEGDTYGSGTVILANDAIEDLMNVILKTMNWMQSLRLQAKALIHENEAAA